MSKFAVWGRHTFVISSKQIYGFEELKIKAQTKTKDQEKSNKVYGKQLLAARESSQPTEVSLKAMLFASLGNDVKKEAREWLVDAHKGVTDRLKINDKDVVDCNLRLVSAEVTDIVLTSTGKWSSCTVNCSFKQSGRWDNKGTTSSSSTKKKSSSSTTSASKRRSTSRSKSSKSSKVHGVAVTANSANRKPSAVRKLTSSVSSKSRSIASRIMHK